MRQDRRHAVEIASARRLDVARAGREAAADHDQAIGADRRALVDHPLVVVDQRLLARRIGRAEQPAAAIAGHLHAVVAEDPRGFIHADVLHVLTPRRDAAHALLHIGLDAVFEAVLLAHGREIDREAFGFHGQKIVSRSAGVAFRPKLRQQRVTAAQRVVIYGFHVGDEGPRREQRQQRAERPGEERQDVAVAEHQPAPQFLSRMSPSTSPSTNGAPG